MRERRALLVGLIALAAAGCGSRPLPIRPSARSFTAGDYEQLYSDWTRGTDEFSFGRLEDVLHVTATFESWEFRWAYVVRYAADYSLRTEERTRLLRSSLADAQERHRFFVTLLGNVYRESDLTDERTSWRVLLMDEEGRQTRPIRGRPHPPPGRGRSRLLPLDLAPAADLPRRVSHPASRRNAGHLPACALHHPPLHRRGREGGPPLGAEPVRARRAGRRRLTSRSAARAAQPERREHPLTVCGRPRYSLTRSVCKVLF